MSHSYIHIIFIMQIIMSVNKEEMIRNHTPPHQKKERKEISKQKETERK